MLKSKNAIRWIKDETDPQLRGWEEFYRNRWQHDKVIRSTHGVNCTGGCSWNIHVKEGIVTWEMQALDYPVLEAGIPPYEPRGCQRGISYSWYLYSPLRVKYPYIRGALLDLWRKARGQFNDPVDAWKSLVDDPEKRARWQKARGKGGLRRTDWATVLALSVAVADRGWAQETAAYFKANCASCHTIGGGRLTGPDLKGVSERAQQAGKDRDWLIAYIQDPQRMINSGDPYAARLLQEARGVVMPKIVGLDAEKAEFLVELIEAESLLEESQFKGAAVSNEPFTARDVQRGLALFTGREELKGGSAMCMSCHRMPGVGALGGGNLGPDLTRVYEQGKHTTGGRATLSAWLMAPATKTPKNKTAILLEHRCTTFDNTI